MNENNFERSIIVNQIINRKPGFIEKWALWMILFLLVAVFWSSSFIKYPVTVKITGTIDTVLYDKPITGCLVRISIPNNYTDIIKNVKKIQLSFYRLDRNKICVFGYIEGVFKVGDKKQLNIIIDIPPNSTLERNEKLITTKNSDIKISITSRKNTVMEMFYHTVTNGIRL